MSASGTKRIRIIKRAATGEAPPARRDGAPETAPAAEGRDAAKAERRDAAAVVTRWVSEMRRRKNEDTAQALKSLFHKAA